MPAQSSLDSFNQDVSHDYGLPGEQLDTVISRFVTAATQDPFTSWLLLPTKRLVLDVTGYLTANNIPFIASRICTLDGFCGILFEENRTTQRFLLKNESKLLLADILEDQAREVSLFITRDHPSPGTIDDLMTFMNVTMTRKVAFPECLMGLQTEKSGQLDTIITEYRNRLRELDLFDSDTILEWTIDHLNRSGSSPLGTIFIYGFHEPLPLEQDLFDTIREHAGKAYFFVPDGLDPNIFKNRATSGNSGSQPALNPSSVRARITGLFSETGTLAAGDLFRVQTFPSRYLEVYGIAEEIARLNADGTPLSDIAIVFPDLRGDLGLIEEIFSDFGIPWNAAVGFKLSRTPVIQFLTGIAGLVASGYSREDIVWLISSPFFRKDVVPGGTSRLDATEVDLVSRYARIDGPGPLWDKQLEWLHQELQDPEKAKNYPGISIHTVERVQEGIRILIDDLKVLAKKKNLRDHISAFRSFLKSWNIPYLYAAPDDQTKEREIHVYQKFCSRLDALANAAWIPADEPIELQDFSRFISAFAEEPDMSGQQDDDGVALLGLRECPHLKFPVVFIGGLVEGTFPRLTTRLPFTNSLENARMGTRTLSEILQEEQYYFIAALLSAQKMVYLSAPLADGEKPLLTSAFFERVRMRIKDSPWPEAAGNILPTSRRTAAVQAGTSIRDEKPCTALDMIPCSLGISDLVERINMERYYRRGACDSSYDGILSRDDSIRTILAGRYGPDHVYSPTSLETYASCPFEYFLNRVIGLEALPEVETNLSAGDRGTAIHDVLSTFYRQWRSAGQTKVNLASLTDATDLILKLATEELDKYTFQSPLWDATRILMLGDRHTGPGYFEKFLLHETEEADSPLVPSRFEFSFGMGTTESDDPTSSLEPVELVSPNGEQKVFIRGRIDRIDLTPDGFFLIYDYKSGAQHPKAKDIEAGTALQLPLYLLAFEKISGNHGIGGGYYTIRRDVDRSIVLADSSAKDLMVSRPRVSADFAGLIQHSRDCAFEYIDGIRNGCFPLPREEKCPNPYCEFKQICRFDPYRVFQCGKET
jgi:ATP-dependent helicase/nuclease subunit B